MPKKKLQYLTLILFLTCLLNICIPCIPVCAEATSMPVSFFSDLAGHWAEREIKAWSARELVGGYPDGTFRPDHSITRAEFIALVNRAFGFARMVETAVGQAIVPASYCDVTETDWYAGEFGQAAAVGYIGGYPDGTAKPQNPITRQEVATVLARILPDHDNPDLMTDDVLNSFIDEAQIPEWSREAITMAVIGGYMSGYPDDSFQPTKTITRAEAIAVLDRAVGQLFYRAGTYGPFQGTLVLEGNVTINTPGVTLQNVTITGNLYLTEGIGEGDVTLNNVTVQGTTKIGGGGKDSIHLRNSTLDAVLVHVPSRNLVRLSAQGSTAVGALEARTPVSLEEEELTGSGFTTVRINAGMPLFTQERNGALIGNGNGTQENSQGQAIEFEVPVELSGQFDQVEIQSPGVHLNLQRGGIATLTLDSSAQMGPSAQTVPPDPSTSPVPPAPPEQPVPPVQITLAAQTTVGNLVAGVPATVQGQGTIDTAQTNVYGVVIGAQVQNVFLADGVEANVAGKTITENYQYVEPRKKNKDVTLSNLTINGTTVPGFAVDTLSYEVVLPFGTTTEEIPTVAATARHAKARVTVTQATALTAPDNVATVLVTAENGRTQTYTVTFTVALDSAKAITGFSLTLTVPEAQVVEGIINEAAKTIAVTVPHGTDLTSLTPTIEHTGESISPASGETQNFSTPVTYTVTAVDGSTEEYVVTVYVAPSTETALSVFAIGGQNVKDLAGVNTAEGATLAVPDFTGFKGISVQTADAEAQSVTVTVNGTEVPEAEQAERAIAANDVIIVTVVAADGESTAQYKVTVVPVSVTGVSLNKTELYLQVGTTAEEALIATVEPADATNKEVTWESDNTDVATVDADGLVTAEAIGTATITVTTVDGGLTAECTVTVVDSDPIIDDSCVLYLDGRYGTNGSPATDTWYDLSGKGNHGTLENFAFAEGNGWTGGELQFDGVDDHVVISNNPSLNLGNEFTVSLWVKFQDVTKPNNSLINFHSSDAGTFVLDYISAGERLRAVVTGTEIANTQTLRLESGKYYHIAYTKNGVSEGASSFYLNGVAIPVPSNNAYNFVDTIGDLMIGQRGVNGVTFVGSMRDIAVYNRALSPAEIAQNYLATKDPEPLSPVDGAVLELNGAEGTNDPATTVWVDASGNGNHATLQNFAFTEGDGWTGDALEFDGVDSYGDCGNNASINIADAITLEAWIKIKDYEIGECIIINKFESYGLDIRPSIGMVHFDLWEADGTRRWNYTEEGILPLSGWIHLAATYADGKPKIYVNGQLQFTVDHIDGEVNLTTNPLYIGKSSGDVLPIHNFPFPGEIGNVRIYPRALSDSEVLQNYFVSRHLFD